MEKKMKKKGANTLKCDSKSLWLIELKAEFRHCSGNDGGKNVKHNHSKISKGLLKKVKRQKSIDLRDPKLNAPQQRSLVDNTVNVLAAALSC
eukprot:scaffold656_cov271-Chaetoceros_neogracile.AAC.47